VNRMNKLAIVGFGKMGRLVEQLSSAHDFEVALRLDEFNNQNGAGMTSEAFKDIDVAIEFSTPEVAPRNLKRLAELKIPSVTGTTGWLEHLPDIAATYQSAQTGLVWSPNFSIGVAVFNRIAGFAAELLKDEQTYEAWSWEIHHSAKKDAPSGTLLHLVDTMKKHGYTRHIDASSSRAGKHPGTHEIGFDSAADTITLRHSARSREGFAQGALKAARWVIGRTGVFTFEQVLFGD
jgi:4-hydroxy-tetrahydrodipicolinate reductase